ncbi:hypothetical protein HFP15_00055 [Amycolatopsis sp. K13G38]|uniref:MFS transporter n=1 Tax=Amycolatopsis acididurans TaxID=2724524 RepID=A0ABX1IZ01_9PSEU|nr:hypothetical protein [Amycolatopsis acididurans]NKQ51271.1 hypothetical protein [Amycolatopsis acididurans]
MGGKAGGPGTTPASTVAGLVRGRLILWVAIQLDSGSSAVLVLYVAVGAFGICVQASWAPLSFTAERTA